MTLKPHLTAENTGYPAAFWDYPIGWNGGKLYFTAEYVRGVEMRERSRRARAKEVADAPRLLAEKAGPKPTCPVCGKPLQLKTGSLSQYTKTCGDPVCKHRVSRATAEENDTLRVAHEDVTKTCPYCGKEFTVPWRERNGKLTCSRTCGARYGRQRREEIKAMKAVKEEVDAV